jgi:hypothetical protein
LQLFLEFDLRELGFFSDFARLLPVAVAHRLRISRRR